MAKVVIIPKGIDLEALFERHGIRQERSKYRLKNYIYYFLSKVVTHQGNIEFYMKYDGFRPVSMKKINLLFDSRNRDRVKKLLMDPDDPIIESNESYQVGKFSKGYRLTKKYRTGTIEFRTLSEQLSSKLNKYEFYDLYKPDYSFLENQFKNYRLEFSDDFENFVLQMGNSLIRLSSNEFQRILVYNKIGAFLSYKNHFNSGWYMLNHSDKNHRFNSILTRVPKELRNFLQIEGSRLVEIDLSSSQPYLLAVLLKEIDNTVEVKLNNNQIDFSLDTYLTYSNNKLINEVYPFMLPAFSDLSSSHKESIRSYYSAPFNNDFYQWVADRCGNRINREKVKNTFMYFLNDDDANHRFHNEVMREIGILFPGLNYFIYLLHKKFGKSDFARFLQMIESRIVIDIILREFHDYYPHIPIFTIHDAILTTEENAYLIQEFLNDRLLKMTSIPPKSKVSIPPSVEFIVEKSINKTWEKIKHVRINSQFQKLEPSIFASNIDWGREFLTSQ